MGRRKTPTATELVAEIDDEEGRSEEEGEERLALVAIDGEGVMGGVEGFCERDEVEEEADDDGGEGDVAPARAVVERGREHGECGHAVEENGDSEPEERHGEGGAGLFRRDTSVYGASSVGERDTSG